MTSKLKEQLSKQEEAKLKNLNEALAAVANEEEDMLPDEIPAEIEGAPIEEPSTEEEAANLEERVSALEEGQAKILEVVERISEKVLGSAEEVPAEESAPVEEAANEMREENAAEESEQSSAEESEAEEVAAEVEAVENSIDEAEAPAEEEAVKDAAESEDEAKSSVEETPEVNSDAEEKEADKETKEENEMTEAEINALVARIKNEILDEKVEAPEAEEVKVEKESNSVSSNWRVRYNQQIEAAWDAYRLKSVNGQKKLQEINAFNYNEQVKAGKIANDIADGPMTMADLGGFILPPEVDKMIHGRRTDYSPLLDAIEIAETTSLQFAYATRSGDIEMRPVKLCQNGSTITDDVDHVRPDNLKPIESYDLVQGLAQLEEMAAVTPICTSVTRFAAADILADVAAGYRTSYDRGLAQLFVIRLQQAINATDNVVEFNPTSDTEALIDFVKATTKVADGVVNGKFMFNAKTKAAILEYLFNSGKSSELSTAAFVNGDFPTIFGYKYVVVPNDLMPTLGEGDVRTFVAQSLDGTQIETVDITSPVFYGDFDEYRGKVYSGGLNYDISAEASYEVYGSTGVTEVRSAWQRNELVLRGAYYRGGYIADPTVFAGMIPVSS